MALTRPSTVRAVSGDRDAPRLSIPPASANTIGVPSCTLIPYASITSNTIVAVSLSPDPFTPMVVGWADTNTMLAGSSPRTGVISTEAVRRMTGPYATVIVAVPDTSPLVNVLRATPLASVVAVPTMEPRLVPKLTSAPSMGTVVAASLSTTSTVACSPSAAITGGSTLTSMDTPA